MENSNLDINKIIENLEPSKLILEASPTIDDFDSLHFQLISGFGEMSNYSFKTIIDWKVQEISSTDILVYMETTLPLEEFEELTEERAQKLLAWYKPSKNANRERNDWMPNQLFHKFVLVPRLIFVYIEDCLLRDVLSGVVEKDQPFTYTLIS